MSFLVRPLRPPQYVFQFQYPMLVSEHMNRLYAAAMSTLPSPSRPCKAAAPPFAHARQPHALFTANQSDLVLPTTLPYVLFDFLRAWSFFHRSRAARCIPWAHDSDDEPDYTSVVGTVEQGPMPDESWLSAASWRLPNLKSLNFLASGALTLFLVRPNPAPHSLPASILMPSLPSS